MEFVDTNNAVEENTSTSLGREKDNATNGHLESNRKAAIAATLLKMDHFTERLNQVRSQIHERNNEMLQRTSIDPQKYRNNDEGPPVLSAQALERPGERDDERWERIQLPRIANQNGLQRTTYAPASGLLSIDSLQARAHRQVEHEIDLECVAKAEAKAADAIQDADRRSEDARIAMVMYTQNERSWGFDERARRYQHVMQLVKEADAARMEADDLKIIAQCVRSKLVDPFAEARMLPARSGPKMHTEATLPFVLEPLDKRIDLRNNVAVWILAAPLSKLPFTPRKQTNFVQLEGEKQLSTHVVYYAAPATESEHETSSNVDQLPSDSWVCCSVHGVGPAPTVLPCKSSIETWMVTGAGALHVNGKYIFTGFHDGTKRFKSSTGIELFRKHLPRSSTIVQGLFDSVDDASKVPDMRQPDEDESDHEGTEPTSPTIKSPINNSRKPDVLPSTLRALESDDRSFKSMEKIGLYMGRNEIVQKRQRSRDADARVQESKVVDESSSHLSVNISVPYDGDHVKMQTPRNKFQGNDTIAVSRPEANAEICREWVLLMRCSRRVVDKSTNVPPKPIIGLGCLKRHYYISVDEKNRMMTWAQEQEAWMEKDVLMAIIRREAHLERAHHLTTKCMSRFQQNLVEDTQKTLRKLLLELNRLRFLTVKVIEAIETWRVHARKKGYTRYEGEERESNTSSMFGWSASITISSGRTLYKGSKAVISKYKRFCRPEDFEGKKEQRIIYLGYFATREEAEYAYDAFAVKEARRLNTTVVHLPRRHNVFRSCGKHYAVESERGLGPNYCIECEAKKLSTTPGDDEWNPPFFYTPHQNYMLKLAHDLDFLDTLPPLKLRLNGTIDGESFPLLGNVFLLPRTPMQDPSLAQFATLGSVPLPFLGQRIVRTKDNQMEEDTDAPLDEALDKARVLNVQQIFLQEMQSYYPQLFQSSSILKLSNQNEEIVERINNVVKAKPDQAKRIVEALYWDRCAAIRIQQERTQHPFKQSNVWCRPDVGEWASFVIRGKHRQHFEFEMKLAQVGKETQEKRKQIIHTIRKLLKTPLYWIPSRHVFINLITEAEQVRGDVVLLEVKNAYKQLYKYDLWCIKTRVIQTWYRGIRGRKRARAKQTALAVSALLRCTFLEHVSIVAEHVWMKHIVPSAIRNTIKTIERPTFAQTTKLDGEFVVVSIYPIRAQTPKIQAYRSSLVPSVCCHSCARRYHVHIRYDAKRGKYGKSGFSSPSQTNVCTCSRNHPPEDRHTEDWLIRAYNPISHVVYRFKMENALLTQLLMTHEHGDMAWNPALAFYAATNAATISATIGNYFHQRGRVAYERCMNWRMLSDEAKQVYKVAVLDLERASAHLLDLQNRYVTAVSDSRKALDFTSRPFHEAQAWDPIESANDWRALVSKRQIELALQAANNDQAKCRFDLFQADMNAKYLRARANEAQHQYDMEWSPLLQLLQSDMKARALQQEISRMTVHRVMRLLCTDYLTLRDAYLVPTRRSLVLQPFAWKQESHTIALPGLQRGRNTLRRRIILLSNRSNVPGERQLKRMIIDVRAWTSSRAECQASQRDVWITAYDPHTSQQHQLFLDYELVRLLTTVRGVKRDKGTFEHERARWHRLSDHLLSLAMLDRFTGEFTLHKLQFYQHMRRLRPQFMSSRWFQDFERGRKSGDGDEILRQAVQVDNRLCFVVIFENWGDLVLVVYDTTNIPYRLVVKVYEIFELLLSRPTMLQLWISCVKSNQYTPLILKYILKLVRFIPISENGNKQMTLQVGPRNDDALTHLSFQRGMSIQGRRVLVNVYDDHGDAHDHDMMITVYDMQQNFTYKLGLDWENVRRVLETSHEWNATQQLRKQRTNLMLRRNRRALFAWICTRLRFQRLLEHPEILNAVENVSPLSTGTQVRQSLMLWNEWITSSVRHPLSILTAQKINEYTARVDSALFQGLQWEQLAWVPDVRLVPDSDKKKMSSWMETRDFSLNGRDRSDGPLKIDFFVRAHQLYARVRHEIEHEWIARRECEGREDMAREDCLSLRAQVYDHSHDLADQMLEACAVLDDAVNAFEPQLTLVTKLHAEIKTRVKVVGSIDDEDVIEAASDASTSSSSISTALNLTYATKEEDVDMEVRTFMNLRQLWHENGSDAVLDIIRREDTLPTTIKIAQNYSRHIRNVWFPKVEEIIERIERVEGNSIGPNMREAHTLLLRFKKSWDCKDLIPTEDDEQEDVLPVIDNFNITRNVLTEVSDKDENQGLLSMIVGLVISTNDMVSPDEITLDTLEISKLLHDTTPLFVLQIPRESTVDLIAQRVSHGIVIYQNQQDAARNGALWNTRVSAIVGNMIRGLALFIPTRIHDGDRSVSMDTFRRADALFKSMVSMSIPSYSSGQRYNNRRPAIPRSKQYLPWKQYSIQRIQSARRARQYLANIGMVFANYEDVRENVAVATMVVSDRDFEWMCGDRLSNVVSSANLTVLFERLALDHSKTSLHLHDHRVISNLFDQQASLDSTLRIPRDHVRVEVDDIEAPKRLTFSCRALQSEESYVLDVDLHYMYTVLKRDLNHYFLDWPQGVLPIREWRSMARQIIDRLTLSRRNGAWCLTVLPLVNVDEAFTLVESGQIEDTVAEDTECLVPEVTLPFLRHSDVEYAESMKGCRTRRFFKHQTRIRALAVERMLETSRREMELCRLPWEWMYMTLEDWSSQECRGVLLLDAKVLKKLNTSRIKCHSRSSHNNTELPTQTEQIISFFLDVATEMGERDLTRDDASTLFQSMQQTSWWYNKYCNGSDENKDIVRCLDVFDTSEWWRRVLVGKRTQELEKKKRAKNTK